MLSVQPPTSPYRPEPGSPLPPCDASAGRNLDSLRRLGRKLDHQDPRLIREAAGLLTSQLFFAPLLAEARKLPFGREYGHGGRMEEAFGEQLDQHIADVVARRDEGLTVQLAARLASRSRGAAAPSPASQDASWPAQSQARQGIAGGPS
jgi:hypothetical protein